MNALLLIPATVFVGTYLVYRRGNRRVFGPVSLIIGVYVAMAVAAITLDLLGLRFNQFELNALAVVYLTVLLTIALWGFMPYRDHRLVTISIDNVVVLRLLEIFLLISSPLGLAFFTLHAIPALSGDLLENRLYMDSLRMRLGDWGLVNSFFSLVANLFGVNIVIGMLSLSPAFGHRRFARTKAWALLVSSTIYIMYTLAYVGRDGAVLWLLTFGFVYLLMRRFVPVHDRRLIKCSVVILGAAALIPFTAISWARFGQNGRDVLLSLVRYCGVQVQHFSDYFTVLDPLSGGWLNFPTFRFAIDGLLGSSADGFSRAVYLEKYVDLGVQPWNFPTFVGSFLFDFGYFVTPFLVIALALATRTALMRLRRNGQFTLSSMIGWVALAQVVLFGVFYFRQGLANWYLIAVVVLVLGFRMLRSEGRRKTIRVVA